MSGDRESRARQFYERAIRKVEPSLKGDAARIPLYLELFKREFVEDTRTFAVDITAQGTTLSGHVEFAEHKTALTQLFKYLALEVDDQVELLPSAALGEKRFAVVTADVTFVRSRPHVAGASARAENLTDCVRGDRLFVLKETADNHLLCHAPDGYVGYVNAADVRRIDDKELARLNAAVPVRHPERIEQVIARAKQHLGTPYVWGGGTTEGCDCSGLVRASFKAAGVVMPRDADQQSLVGRLVGTRWHRSSLRRGDTLFFLGRRGNISHTAIYLGDGKMIEATSPVVTVSSFNPSDEDYSERRDDTFCYAKRVIE
jgi:cell wall-associated NlpC family hydrolase